MKKDENNYDGKFVKLKNYNEFQITYGTVRQNPIASIWIEISSYVQPEVVSVCEITKILKRYKHEIKHYVASEMTHVYFHPEMIIDFEFKYENFNRKMLTKKSFFQVNMNLFTKQQFNIKNDPVFSLVIQKGIHDIIDILNADECMEFSRKKVSK